MISTLGFKVRKGLRVLAKTFHRRNMASLRDVLSEQIPKKQEQLNALKKEYGYMLVSYDILNAM